MVFTLALGLGACDRGETKAITPAQKPRQPDVVRVPPEAERQIVVEPVRTKAVFGDLGLSGKVQYSEDRYAKVSDVSRMCGRSWGRKSPPARRC